MKQKARGPKPHKMSGYHCGVSAEAYAAALFARCGLDVSVQYGANQPEYDLLVAKGQRLLRLSVKGSQDGGWGLTQTYMKKGSADYQGSIDVWLSRHNPDTVFCLVQFKGVELTGMPRLYLATAREVADQLRQCANKRGETMLMERKEWSKKAQAAGTVDQIPESWKFSPERIEQLLSAVDLCPECGASGAKK